MGDAYTIADIATFPWVRNLVGFYEAGELVGIADFPAVTRALAAFLARPAVARGPRGATDSGATLRPWHRPCSGPTRMWLAQPAHSMRRRRNPSTDHGLPGEWR